MPVLRSGGYLPSLSVEADGTFTAGDDLLGYETDYYVVHERPEGGVIPVFVRGEVVQKGRRNRTKAPRLQLFSQTETFRLIRLWHRTRESSADHDMLLLLAADEASLDRLSKAIKSGDSQRCRNHGEARCVVVPLGVAIIPEEKGRGGRSGPWVPVK